MTAYRRAAEVLREQADFLNQYALRYGPGADRSRQDEMLALAEELEKQPMENLSDAESGKLPEAESMAQFRKKPVVIEAMQLTSQAFDAPHPNPAHIPGVLYDPLAKCAFIDTMEGRMRANLGDWIIRGVKGELYPCKPDIFAATYEPALLPSSGPVSRPVSGSNETTAAIPYAKDFPSPRAVSPIVNEGKDGERMDWLDKIELIGIDHVGYGDYRIYAGAGFPSIREAIDAAMSSPPDSQK